MTEYSSRTAKYFLQFMRLMKNDSGILRWNSLCEDILKLYNIRYPNNRPYDEIEFWNLIFESDNISFIDMEILEEKCKDPNFSSFLFYLLHAFTDPPASWWNQQFMINK
jgi:hypothetical protein